MALYLSIIFNTITFLSTFLNFSFLYFFHEHLWTSSCLCVHLIRQVFVESEKKSLSSSGFAFPRSDPTYWQCGAGLTPTSVLCDTPFCLTEYLEFRRPHRSHCHSSLLILFLLTHPCFNCRTECAWVEHVKYSINRNRPTLSSPLPNLVNLCLILFLIGNWCFSNWVLLIFFKVQYGTCAHRGRAGNLM